MFKNIDIRGAFTYFKFKSEPRSQHGSESESEFKNFNPKKAGMSKNAMIRTETALIVTATAIVSTGWTVYYRKSVLHLLNVIRKFF